MECGRTEVLAGSVAGLVLLEIADVRAAEHVKMWNLHHLVKVAITSRLAFARRQRLAGFDDLWAGIATHNVTVAEGPNHATVLPQQVQPPVSWRGPCTKAGKLMFKGAQVIVAPPVMDQIAKSLLDAPLLSQY